MKKSRCFLLFKFFIKICKQSYFLFLDLLFPWECIYCKKETKRGQYLCKSCFHSIVLNTGFICPYCQYRLPNPWKKNCSCSGLLYSLGAVSNYQNPVLRQAIHSFKYQQIISLTNPLSQLLIQFLKENKFLNNVPKQKIIVIPIPLHRYRKQERGFNQAELLAEKVSQHFHLCLDTKSLQRIRHNPPQVKIEDYEQRKINAQGIFQVTDCSAIKNKIILLVDDVYTSGATMQEAAKVLKKAGAKKIIGLVIAK